MNKCKMKTLNSAFCSILMGGHGSNHNSTQMGINMALFSTSRLTRIQGRTVSAAWRNQEKKPEDTVKSFPLILQLPFSFSF